MIKTSSYYLKTQKVNTFRKDAFFFQISSKGNCYFSDEKMGVYRHHDGGITNLILKKQKQYLLYRGVDHYTNKKYSIEIKNRLATR